MQVPFIAIQLVLLAAISAIGAAQADKPLEIGAQFTALHINPIGEGAGSVGARASYDLHFEGLTVAPEVEFNYFPENPSGNFGETQLLAGVRTGVKIDEFGFFVKTRPGLVHFGGGDFKERNGSSTNFAFDVGGVFEYSISPRVAIRLDWGDTLIHFPRPVVTGQINPIKPAGWYHNFQGGGGLSFRF